MRAQSILLVFVLLGSVLFSRFSLTSQKSIAGYEESRSLTLQARSAVVAAAIEPFREALPPRGTPPLLPGGDEPLPPLPAVVSSPKEFLAPAAPPKAAAPPEIAAAAFLVSDLDEPFALLESNPYYRHPTASLAKLMAALIARERVGFEKEVTVDARAVAAEGENGGLKSGDAFSVRDLVSVMLLVSSNDAAEAIAGFYGRDTFIQAMNEKAAELGMVQTNFADPTGLSPLDQSSAADWHRLIIYLTEAQPDILAFSAERARTVIERRTGEARTLTNIHPFAGNPAFIGGKTGYTDEARGNLISLFRLNNRRYLIILLGAEDRSRETKKLYDFIAGN